MFDELLIPSQAVRAAASEVMELGNSLMDTFPQPYYFRSRMPASAGNFAEFPVFW